MRWREAPTVNNPDRQLTLHGGSGLTLFAPLGVALIVALAFVALGRPVAALIVAISALVLTQLRALSHHLNQVFTDAADATGRWIGRTISFAILASLFLVLQAGRSLGALVTRRTSTRDEMRGGGWFALDQAGPSNSTWRGSRPLNGHAPIGQPGDVASADGTGRPQRRVIRFIGVVAVVCFLDICAGALLTGTGWLPPEDRGDIRQTVEASVAATMATPPIVGDSWARQYASDLSEFELGGTESDQAFVPFLVRGFQRYTSDNINVTEEERLSYQPPISRSDTPLSVAFFGGSVMFGVGQRDGHTIPSEFARVAAANGVPVEVHNYGLPTWVSWQEQLYLEQLLARGRQFDLIIFLDGFNEFEIQKTGFSADPTHNAAGWINSIVGDFRAKRQTSPTAADGVSELLSSYGRNSALWRIGASLTGRRQLLQGQGTQADGTFDDQTDAALDIYARSLDRIDDLTADHDTITRYFWQPQPGGWPPDVLDRLPAQVVSLNDVFDGRDNDLYIDDIHTNEEGARLIADAMWATLGADVTALAAHDG